MLRHRLASLFEPRSLLVLSDRDLPVAQSVPATLRESIAFVAVRSGEPIVIPPRLPGVEVAQRLDAALVCVEPARLPQALAALATHRPRPLVLLRQIGRAHV